MRKLFRFLAATISVFTLAGLGTALYYEQTLADQYYIRQGETFTVGSSITATAVPASNAVPVSQTDQGQLVQLSLFGCLLYTSRCV